MDFIIKNIDNSYEHIANSLLISLYEYVHEYYDENNTNQSLEGKIEVLRGYQSMIDYLQERFPNLYIMISRNSYVEFEDDLVKTFLATNLGDGNGVIESDLSEVTRAYANNNLRLPEGCRKFNEFKYFTSITSLFGFGNSEPFFMLQDCINTLEEIDLRNITTLLRYNFKDFVNLKVINNTDNIISIGSGNFINCTSLENIKFSNLTAIDGGNFEGCTSLKTALIDGTMTSINDRMFNGCTSLETVRGFSSATSIRQYAFNNCTSLTTLDIPIENITSIGNYAFQNCNSLDMDDFDFTNVTFFYEGALQRTTLKQIEFTSKPFEIRGGCFYECKELTSIILPNNITTQIGNFTTNLFYGCSKLTSITLPSNQTNFTLGGQFAYDCSLLQEINNIENCIKINYRCFRNCSSLNNIDISNVQYIGEGAFLGCLNLESIDLSSCIELGSWDIFLNCKKLYEIKNTENITNIIPGNCFRNVGIDSENDMTHIYLPKVTELKNNVFDGSAIKTIEFRDISIIGSSTFNNCKKLTTITGLDNVLSIGNNGFSGCTSLTSISLPSLQTVGYDVFWGCTSLTSISAPVLQTIGAKFLMNCTSLETVDLRGATLIVNSNSFSGAKFTSIDLRSIETITTESTFLNNDKLTTVNLSSLKTAQRYLFQGCKALTTISLPSMIALPRDGFRNCENLVTINLSNDCIEIGQSCFNTCKKLKNIDMSHFVTIYGWAFENCEALKSIDLSSCESLGQGAFKGCIGLNTDIIIPATITELPVECFYNDKLIKSITLMADSVVTYGNSCISTDVIYPIYVPDALVNNYKTASGWSNIASRIKPISEKPNS